MVAMKKILTLVGALTVLAAVAAGVVVGTSAWVSAFDTESHVDNALVVPQSLDGFLGTTLFPVEFVVEPIPVGLSDSFKQSGFRTVTAEVWVQCKDPALNPDVKWMGDMAYLASEDPADVLPGGGVAGPYPPSIMFTSPNEPWSYIGGSPLNCPNNLVGVLTQAGANAIVLDKQVEANSSATLYLGLDVPLCKFNWHLSTRPAANPSGWAYPTLVMKKGDPRFEDQAVDEDCAYDLGMDVEIRVVDIQ